jgi:Escherichia/Staphylococcus phage prohead protease
MSVTVQEAAQRRAEAAEKRGVRARSANETAGVEETAPYGLVSREAAPVPAQMRAGGEVERDGKKYLKLDGFASTYDQGYEMWDLFGPYEEVVGESAGAESLSRNPDVVYQENHGGRPFARTTQGTLDLTEPGSGLWTEAYLNPTRGDAVDLYKAVDEKSIREMSFMFRIVEGRWSPDYTEYRIVRYDIDRGDVSPVTFGANPHTSIEARAAQFALTNNVLRAARAMDDDQRSLLRDAIGAVPEAAVSMEPSKLGARAVQDLRLLRASVDQGDLSDPLARASLVAVLDDVIDGRGQLRAGDGPLAVLLNLRTQEAPPAAAVPAKLTLDLVEREIAAARRF